MDFGEGLGGQDQELIFYGFAAEFRSDDLRYKVGLAQVRPTLSIKANRQSNFTENRISDVKYCGDLVELLEVTMLAIILFPMFATLVSSKIVLASECNTNVTRRFDSISEIPSGALKAFGRNIADKGQPFAKTDVIIEEKMPSYRFIYAYQQGCVLHLNYERGGRAYSQNTATIFYSESAWKLVRDQ